MGELVWGQHTPAGMRLREYWAHGEGAAKIRWGTPDDWRRCVRLVREEVGEAGGGGIDVEGYCNEIHHEVLGYWPAQSKQHEGGHQAARHGGGFDPSEPRDRQGQWTHGPGGGGRADRRAIEKMGPGDRLSVGGVDIERVGEFFFVTIGGQTRVYDTAAGAYSAATAGKHNPRLSSAPVTGAAGPALLTLPPLVTLPGVELAATGTWKLSTGEVTFTREDLAAAVAAQGCPSVRSPIIHLGHNDDREGFGGDGEPGLGRVRNLRLDATGNKLIGDLVGVPGWLGAIAGSAFPDRSIEATFGFACQAGHVHQFALTGLALLGVTPPGIGAIGSLADIASRYGVAAATPAPAPARQGRAIQLVIKGGPMAGFTIEDVRRAFYAAGLAGRFPQSAWVTEIQMDDGAGSPQLIVMDDTAGKTYRVPVTLAASGVEFGDMIEVATSYADVAAARGTGMAVVFASAEDSRQPLEAAVDKGNIDTPDAADLDAAARRYCAAQGWAMADGAYPIRPANLHGEADLAKAIHAVGRGNASGESIRRHIMSRASALGKSDTLPDTWRKGGALAAGADHEPYDGEHDHEHPANGSQGGDQAHSHRHAHAGDAKHDHQHAAAGAAGNTQPPARPTRPAASGGGQAHAGAAGRSQEGATDVDFNEEQMAALRAALGLPTDGEVTPAAVVTLAESKVKAAGGPRVPAGAIVIDQQVFDDMQKRIKRGEDARQAQLVQARDVALTGAIQAGKFPPSRRPHWERLWDKDPEGTREVIAGLRPGQVPLADIGEPGSIEPGFDEEFADLWPPAPSR